MADVTRDSFVEQSRYVEVTFQRNKDVIDAELNELQKITRVNYSKALRVLAGNKGGCYGDGFLVVGGGTNKVTVTAGLMVFRGYSIELFANTDITGLSTPGGARTDCVWVKLQETEIDSVLDPSIAVSQLGETTRRRRSTMTLGVTENSVDPPADSGGEPWAGGIKYLKIANLYRTASAVVAANTVVDRRHIIGNADANAYIKESNCAIHGNIAYSSDGVNISFTDFQMWFPGCSGTIFFSGLIPAPAVGEMLGWDNASGRIIRKNLLVNTQASDAVAESSGGSVITTSTVFATIATSQLVDGFFMIGYMAAAGQFVLRSGITLRLGDTTAWGQSGSSMGKENGYIQMGGGPYQEERFFPQHRALNPDGIIRSVIDHNGFRTAGNVCNYHEQWLMSTGGKTGTQAQITGATPGWFLDTAVGGGLQQGSPDSAIQTNYADLFTLTANNDACLVYTDRPMVYTANDNSSVVMEWAANFSAVGAGINNSYMMGFTESSLNTTFLTAGGLYWGKTSAQDYFHATFIDTTTPANNYDFDTGFEPTVNTWYLFRIEWHGKNAPYANGTKNKAIFFVNGVAYAEASVSATGMNWRLAFGIRNTAGTAANRHLRISPVDLHTSMLNTNINL